MKMYPLKTHHLYYWYLMKVQPVDHDDFRPLHLYSCPDKQILHSSQIVQTTPGLRNLPTRKQVAFVPALCTDHFCSHSPQSPTLGDLPQSPLGVLELGQ